MKRKTRSDQPTAVALLTTTGTGTSGAHTASASYVMPGPLPYYPSYTMPYTPPPFYPTTWPSTLPQIHTGHILGDPEVVAHCPFCGSGDIVAGADQTILCSFCNRSFLVMEQPQYNSMPGQPGATTDATMPGSATPPAPEEGIPGADPSASEPPGPATDTPSAPQHAPVNPQTDPETLKKAPPFSFKSSRQDGSIFRTASGHQVDEDDFVKHVAFRVDRDFLVRR